MSKLEVLTPANSQLIFIDQQPQMAFGVQSIDRQTLKNNVVGLAKAAKIFNVPTTITTVETQSFSGNTFPELLAVFPENDLLERTSMNSWDDQNVRDALAKTPPTAARRSSSPVSGLKYATPPSPSLPSMMSPNTKSTWSQMPPAVPRPTHTNTQWTAWCRQV